jgi:hypothetical protein
MKSLIITILLFVFVQGVLAQTKQSVTPDKNKQLLVVEASCGQCKFGLPGKDCDLAVRINGKDYFVDGTDIDSHGDAHAKEGFCNSIRKAEVQGEIVKDRFHATYFHLLEPKPTANPKPKNKS